MRRYIFLIMLFILLSLLSCCSITGNLIQENEEPEHLRAYFCPESNCSEIIAEEMLNAESSVYCAFYEIELGTIVDALKSQSGRIEVKLVTDDKNPSGLSFSATDKRAGLMHNKFCVIDNEKVITGSYNPTYSGLDNQNNILVAKSERLARNYLEEFGEFDHGYFGNGNRVRNENIMINNTKVMNYFCPEDWCSDKVLKTVNLANESIYFMIFSFTDDSIGDLLVKKSKEGVKVKGLLDNFQNKGSQYSEYRKLLNAGINVSLWGDSDAFLHNKVLVIDSEIVITGSYNPTKNGDRVNDENLVIIHDKAIAGKYNNKTEELFNIKKQANLPS